MKEPEYPHGKATALLAYAIDIESPNAIDRKLLNRLLDDVCCDETERIRLISYLSTSQNPQLPSVILELLGARLDRLRDELETAEDMDAVYGIWGQRTAGGALLAGVGFVVTGVVTGGWAVVPLVVGIAAAVGTSYGRDRLKRRCRTARRAVEQTERLIETIKANLPKKG